MARRLRELFSPWLVQMLHNPTVLPAHVSAGFWLKPIAPENMPVIAAQLLASGCDSPAVRVAAGLAAHGDPRSIGSASLGALVGAGGWIPGRAAACARRGGGCGLRSTCRKGK
jgi:hypothetical protein